MDTTTPEVSDDGVFVVGTIFDRKIFTIQHGWVRPENTHALLSGLIYGRQEAERLLHKLMNLPCHDHLGELAVFKMEIRFAKNSLFY